MSVTLFELFDAFCRATDGRLRWSDDRKVWSEYVLNFLDEFMRAKGYGDAHRNYMGIDAVWRTSGLDYIELAVEHENEGKTARFLAQEIRHLLDLKSLNKVAITYPHMGEERETITTIKQMVPLAAMLASNVFTERYLVIFGFDTRREGKRAILWRGHFISSKGEVEEQEIVVFQQS